MKQIKIATWQRKRQLQGMLKEGDREERHISLHRPLPALSSCSGYAPPTLATFLCRLCPRLAPGFCSPLPGALLLCEECGFADFLDRVASIAAAGPPAPPPSPRGCRRKQTQMLLTIPAVVPERNRDAQNNFKGQKTRVRSPDNAALRH